ncbi:MAG: HAMP domain-containing protein [Thiotrichales bacterium]|nr:HAMP domain-containing protein [Thiotrichales bacterium]
MGLRIKLIGFLLLFGLVILSGFLWANQYVLQQTILHYVDQRDQQRLERLKNNFESYLQSEGLHSLNELDEMRWRRLLLLSHRVDLSQNPERLLGMINRESKRRLPDLDEFEQRVGLSDAQGQRLYGPEIDQASLHLPLYAEQQLLGHLSFQPQQSLTEQADIEFARSQFMLLVLGAFLITVLILLVLWPLANHLLLPIRQLNQSLHQLAGGKYQTRIAVNRQDEFGALQRNFNHLAATLEAALASRNQWVADISHELRTPLTILKGSLDALQDGIRPLNAQALDTLQQEVELLQRLIEDLYQLSLSDVGALQYQMAPLDFAALLQSCLNNFQTKAEKKGLRLALCTPLPPGGAWIEGDAKRLSQLLGNLLNNAIAYTDPQPTEPVAEIQVRLEAQGKVWRLSIEDCPPGVSASELAQLGERFFRTDPSRNRRSGGAGLGLAMVRKIVQAHQGQWQIGASILGGLSVQIHLPKQEDL